ncbi:MAG: type VI secretion system protein TssA [Alphaproteobacteria bacterium]
MNPIDDLNVYLKDIPGKDPQGKDLKYDVIYDDIQEASREDLDLPQGVWVKDLKTADWKKVETLCTGILTDQSKDLQIASWLIRSWMFLYNIEGLQKGFELLLKLSEKYWDIAYPAIGPDDLEYRVGPFNWINEKLSEYLNRIIITAPTDKDTLVYSFSAYIDTHYTTDTKVAPNAANQVSREKKALDLKASVKKTDTAFFAQFKESVDQTKETIKTLQTFLDQKLEKSSPSLYRIQEKLDQFNQYLEMILTERRAEEQAKENAKKTTETIQLEPVSADKPSSLDDVIHGRAEAYAMIEKAAEYLSQLDPHSPAPYLIKRAVRWGNLPFEDLLKEMVADGNALTDLRRLLGVAGNAPLGNNQVINAASSNASKEPAKPLWSIQE